MDLRENMETYIKRVHKGESLTVVRRSEPVFRITPVEVDDEEGWETVIDFTKIRKSGVPAEEVQAAIQKILSE
jgi:prevent-host-death family protein